MGRGNGTSKDAGDFQTKVESVSTTSKMETVPVTVGVKEDLDLFTPGKINGWNLTIHPWKRRNIFQTIIFRFYVNLGFVFQVFFVHFAVLNHHCSPPFGRIFFGLL